MLHEWHIDPKQYARHQARRGRRHAFERVDPVRTALVVVDMVPFFVGSNPYARGIVTNVQNLAQTVRAVGGIDVAPDDLLVEKSSPGAFFPGMCELPALLEARGIETVVITRTVANVCCESTARDASAVGYRVIFVADANAAVCDADLNATARRSRQETE